MSYWDGGGYWGDDLAFGIPVSAAPPATVVVPPHLLIQFHPDGWWWGFI